MPFGVQDAEDEWLEQDGPVRESQHIERIR